MRKTKEVQIGPAIRSRTDRAQVDALFDWLPRIGRSTKPSC